MVVVVIVVVAAVVAAAVAAAAADATSLRIITRHTYSYICNVNTRIEVVHTQNATRVHHDQTRIAVVHTPHTYCSIVSVAASSSKQSKKRQKAENWGSSTQIRTHLHACTRTTAHTVQRYNKSRLMLEETWSMICCTQRILAVGAVLRIRTLAGRGGHTAAAVVAVSQQGLELREIKQGLELEKKTSPAQLFYSSRRNKEQKAEK